MPTNSHPEVFVQVRILLFDTTAFYPASPLFFEALEQLSAESPDMLNFEFFDEGLFGIPRGGIARRLTRRILKRRPIDLSSLNTALLDRARAFRPDLLLVSKGWSIAPATLATIKREMGALLINYATDDPFNPNVSTRDLVTSIPLYDIYACTKRAIMSDVTRAGSPRVIHLLFGYKPEVHFPEQPKDESERANFAFDVVFAGGCDTDRIPFLTALIKTIPTLKLGLYGHGWNRWPSLRRYWRGSVFGREFRLALSGSKIALNLVRRANRDDHVMRTFEIPACGAFMLAERTLTHLDLFNEGHSAAYFGNPQELTEQVSYYLYHDRERETIARNGYVTVTRGGHRYKDRLISLFNQLNLSPLISERGTS